MAAPKLQLYLKVQRRECIWNNKEKFHSFYIIMLTQGWKWRGTSQISKIPFSIKKNVTCNISFTLYTALSHFFLHNVYTDLYHWRISKHWKV